MGEGGNSSKPSVSRRNFVKATGGTAIVMSVAGCPESGGSGPDELRLSHDGPEDIPWGWFASSFAEKVENRSDGELKINVFAGPEMGPGPEQVEGAISGSIDMGINGYNVIGAHYQDISVFEVPYLYEDYDHLKRATDPEESELAATLNQNLIEETGLRMIMPSILGLRQMTLNKQVYEPADMEGVTLRVSTGEMYRMLWLAMDATPVSIPFAEVPQALSTGAIDGQENPVFIVQAASLNDLQDYLIETAHLHHASPLYINEERWGELSEDKQSILTETAREVFEEEKATIEENESATLDELEDTDMEIISPEDGLDRQAFADIAHSTFEDEFPKWSDYIEQIKNA